MRPVREITAEEENFRTVELIPGNPKFLTSKKDPIEPEPVGTILLMAFRICGYDPDCDGSLMARVEHIDKDGSATGWEENCIGLYSDTALVVTIEEWAALFKSGRSRERSTGEVRRFPGAA